ncbi:hypothetical protein BC937DRAFT_88617 [Endogone sp. FLAS-F59071]|nr:hypothetical protein BC937DRAFT_88617 [Endogone sp. FLAS-F59071]|eukprot:RUS22523.1 hypothetical protein BC937DRAFT_88617 [Endogone sp. FLAS-F59071]
MAHTTDPELDVDDEQPDFRALLANTSKCRANAQIIPRRGAKDFGPDGSDKQAELITESRDALITLIKEERKVSSKNVCHGMYSLRTGLTRIDTIRGNYLHNMGHTVAGKITLYPEEALFLVSRGALAAVLEEGEEEAYTTGPLSFQQAWARMVGEDDDWTRVRFERYQVYAYLKRLGYITIRSQLHTTIITLPSSSQALVYTRNQIIARFLSPLLWVLPWLYYTLMPWQWKLWDLRSITKPGRYRSYATIFSRLQIIPSRTRSSIKPTTSLLATQFFPSQLEYTIDFDVYKPLPTWKKSDPGEPDYRVVVCSSRTPPPTLPTLTRLFQTIRTDYLRRQSRRVPTANLQGGSAPTATMILFAVVDEGGGVAFVRVTDDGAFDISGGL